MPVWSYIVIAIALLLLFLALLRAKLTISYDDASKLKLYVQVLFIKVPITFGKKSNISIKAVFKTLGKLLKALKIEIEQLNIVIACEDASQTALVYTGITQSLNGALEYLDTVSSVDVAKNAQISIQPSYTTTKSLFSGKVNVYVGVLFFLYWYLILLNLKYD